jgi:hypothetical protein
MKDFYMRLGIYPNSGQGVAVDAINAHSSKAVQAAARAILLSPGRRAQYNAAHAHLKRIAQLRANLGLRRNELWTECEVDDFDVEPRGHHSQLQVLRNSLSSNQTPEKELAQRPGRWSRKNKFKAIAALVACLALAFWLRSPTDQSNRTVVPSVDSQPPVSLSSPAWETRPRTNDDGFRQGSSEVMLPAVPRPRTGALTDKCRFQSDKPELRIHSAPNSGDFFVKLYRFGTRIEVCRAFIRNGETARLSLRGDDYEIHYASGDTWYGEDEMFGRETGIAKGLEAIELREVPVDGGVQLMGGELFLEKQLNGNFPDVAIDKNRF